ncbi:MAG: hypothetical protein OEM91_07345, partial [Hyphomicrobiales bacterium]|nr:hypothetical protein [Hyphomicrobiales bacterium]
ICGLLPMALQVNMNFIDRTVQLGSITSIWWVQLSTAIIFGLGFATLLTLVLTPVMLVMPSFYRGKWRRWRSGDDEDMPAVALQRRKQRRRKSAKPRALPEAAE